MPRRKRRLGIIVISAGLMIAMTVSCAPRVKFMPPEKVAARKIAPTSPEPRVGEPVRHLPRLREEVRVLLPNGEIAMMDMEEYLRGVLPREMSPDAPMDALKAQAVVSRCFANAARWHLPEGAHLCTTTHCQAWSPTHYDTTDRAVEETQGIVATYHNAIIEGFYFGHCDGRTRSSEEVGWHWLPYCRTVKCPCGNKKLWGHGVGMCQEGACEMARRGKTFDEIVTHYLTGVEVVHGVHREAIETIVIDSRQPDGSVTAPPFYQELDGDFYDSTAKSTAPGLTGKGSRFSTNERLDARVRFVPQISRPGLYDIYISAGNYDSTYAQNTQFRVFHKGTETIGNLDLTRVTCGSRWFLVIGDVEFDEEGGYLELSERAPQHDRFVLDGVKFVLTNPLQ